ncbi:MAG: cytochrome C peroxidase [Verrucomicrobiaceae bacterium]|nr:cytochrome C peroxidase [Verrucomicrobiaceae bacterium]
MAANETKGKRGARHLLAFAQRTELGYHLPMQAKGNAHHLRTLLCWVALACSVGAADLKLIMTHDAAGPWTLTRLSYLVSEVNLESADGTKSARHEGFAGWVTKDRPSLLISGLPSGTYQKLNFEIGLVPKDNQRDPATWGPDHPLNPRVCGLHWSWQGGYIFMALEGQWKRKDGTLSGYAYHLGNDFMRTRISLPAEITLNESGTTEVEVRLDVATVLKGIDFIKDGASTHSADDDPLAYQLRDKLKQAFRLMKVGKGETVAPSAEKMPLTLKLGTLPQPRLPADNPLTPARVALGKKLFHETALSRGNTISCSSCHMKENALSDPRRLSPGVEGRLGDRNAMPLFNLAWKDTFFWDGRATTLREQALVPIQDHREMDESLPRVMQKLRAYSSEFKEAFGSPEITPERLGMAIEAYLLTLTSHNSKFDRAQRGELKLSADEQRGFELFMTEREPRLGTMGADCFHCHGGALFTDHQFRNNGLAIDEKDTGRHRVTKSALDKGTFVTPTLRNIALTAPYMHDGRFKTLEEVLNHYSHGIQRTDTLDPNLAKHPDGGLDLSEEDKRCVIEFLKTLSHTD